MIGHKLGRSWMSYLMFEIVMTSQTSSTTLSPDKCSLEILLPFGTSANSLVNVKIASKTGASFDVPFHSTES